LSGLESKVDKSFCDERFERVLETVKASIAPVGKEVEMLRREISTLSKQLKRNGNPTPTNSSKAGKYIFYGTVVTTMGLLAKEVIVFINSLV